MFGTIRKHQTWLWAVIITLTVISFVVYFSPYQRMGGSLGKNAVEGLGTINGEPVTPEAYGAAMNEVRLQYFLRRGTFPDRDPMAKQMGFNEEREIYTRMLLVQKLKQMNLHASPAQVAQLAAELLRNFSKSGPVPLDAFERQVLNPNKLTANDLERFLEHEIELQQLGSVIGLSGTLLTPQEAQALYRHEHEEIVSRLVFFPASNYLASVTVSPAGLADFYTNHMAEYRVPERLQVSYVEFDVTNFWVAGGLVLTNSVTNLTEAVEQVYRRNTNAFADAKSPEEAKRRIIHEEIGRVAMGLARSNAASVADAAMDRSPLKAENLAIVARERGLTVKISSPFDREGGPADLKGGAGFAKAAFGLNPEEPIAGPISGDDGAFAIAAYTNLPSFIPPLDAIREKVTQDYRLFEASKLAQLAGAVFQQTLTNGLAQDKSFATICREAKVNPMLLPAFSRSTRSLPEVENLVPIGGLQDIAFRVPVGRASQFFPMGNGGFILFVESRQPMDEAKMRAELPAFLTMLRQTAQNEAFNDWFRRQAETGLRNTPLNRPPAGTGQRSGR